MSVETGNFICINVRLLLRFFDEKPSESQRHATSIVAVAGEDLGVGLLKHCLEHTQSAKVKILSGTPTTGKQKGSRLDRWVDVVWSSGSGQLYQTEIKNWSAHAIGGRILKVDASPDEIREHRITHWQEQWDNQKNTLNWESTRKVLTPMKRPSEVDPSHTLEPLIIYWSVLHPEGLSESFFSRNLGPGQKFSRLWFFSMSQYLRNLNEDFIEIEMPIVSKRLHWLSELFAGK